MRQLDGLSFKNNTGSTIEPGAAIEITGSIVEEGEIVLEIQKPTSAGIAKDLILFNGPVEVPDGGGGRAQVGPLIIAVKTGSPSLGDEVGPGDNAWTISTGGGGFTYLGDDPTDAFPNSCLVMRRGGSIVWYRATLTTGWTGTTASADLFDYAAGTSLSLNVTVNDPLGTFSALTTGDSLEVKKYLGAYYTNQAPCGGP